MSEYLDVAERMASAVTIPVIADCDTGFGNSNNVINMVKRFEAAGVAAVSIEDKLFPKVNSFIPGRQELASIAEFVGKIMAAKNAQRGPEFMVIARVEALIAGWGLEEAIKRADAYWKAGADAILIHSKSKTSEEIFQFIGRWENRCPLVVVPTTYFDVPAAQWQDAGVTDGDLRESTVCAPPSKALTRNYKKDSGRLARQLVSRPADRFDEGCFRATGDGPYEGRRGTVPPRRRRKSCGCHSRSRRSLE